LRNGRSCDGQRRSEINRGGRIGRWSRTTVRKTEARNERAGWAARTPDIESEERNAEIGITVMLRGIQVAPEKMKPRNKAEKQNN
jgi:hypothetical protein